MACSCTRYLRAKKELLHEKAASVCLTRIDHSSVSSLGLLKSGPQRLLQVFYSTLNRL